MRRSDNVDNRCNFGCDLFTLPSLERCLCKDCDAHDGATVADTSRGRSRRVLTAVSTVDTACPRRRPGPVPPSSRSTRRQLADPCQLKALLCRQRRRGSPRQQPACAAPTALRSTGRGRKSSLGPAAASTTGCWRYANDGAAAHSYIRYASRWPTAGTPPEMRASRWRSRRAAA